MDVQLPSAISSKLIGTGAAVAATCRDRFVGVQDVAPVEQHLLEGTGPCRGHDDGPG